jgi:putative heme iron utilization protein
VAGRQTLSALLGAERFGVLATLSVRQPGWPFASLTAYALDQSGQPVLFLSDLAEHTRNLRADGRASLLVHDTRTADDPLASERVTLLGHLGRIDQEIERAATLASYLARHPSAEQYASLADFHLYRLAVTEARPIVGFGDMGWLSGEALHQALGGLPGSS